MEGDTVYIFIFAVPEAPQLCHCCRCTSDAMTRMRAATSRARSQAMRSSRQRCGLVVLFLVCVAVLTFVQMTWRGEVQQTLQAVGSETRDTLSNGEVVDNYSTGVGASGDGMGILKHIAHTHLQPHLFEHHERYGRKIVAYAITLTKDGNFLDGAAVLAVSIGER